MSDKHEPLAGPAGAVEDAESAVDAATWEQVRRLEKFIGDSSYTTTSVNVRGHLKICLCYQGWRERSAWALFWEGVRMLWRALHPADSTKPLEATTGLADTSTEQTTGKATP